jgi:hypothetical protein
MFYYIDVHLFDRYIQCNERDCKEEICFTVKRVVVSLMLTSLKHKVFIKNKHLLKIKIVLSY